MDFKNIVLCPCCGNQAKLEKNIGLCAINVLVCATPKVNDVIELMRSHQYAFKNDSKIPVFQICYRLSEQVLKKVCPNSHHFDTHYQKKSFHPISVNEVLIVDGLTLVNINNRILYHLIKRISEIYLFFIFSYLYYCCRHVCLKSFCVEPLNSK